MKSHNGMRPQDIVVLLKILSLEDNWLNKDIASSLFISNSEVSESLNRSMIAGLLAPDKKMVMKNSLFDLIVHGIKYVFPAEPGGLATGLATSHGAPVLSSYFIFDKNDQYVWPSPFGKIKGYAIKPFYPNQILAALNDNRLYDMLALVDAIRVGRTRERNKAVELLKDIFQNFYVREYSPAQSHQSNITRS